MTSEQDDGHLDHGDKPITLAEILEANDRNPIKVRIRYPHRRSAKTRWHPHFEAPDKRRPETLLDVGDWIEP